MNHNNFLFYCTVCCGLITAISTAEISSHLCHGQESFHLDPHPHSSEQPINYGGLNFMGVVLATTTTNG